MKTILAIAILGITMIPAYYTGNSRRVTTVTGQQAISCEYRLNNGQKFWRTFGGYSCPSSVEVY